MLYTNKSALIVGAGAVGAVLGAALLAAGWHVTFRVRPERFLGYRRFGLVVRRGGRVTVIDRERFVCDAVARGSHRLVLLCVRMPDFERAIHGLTADDDGERVYVTTQDGLAAPQMCAALFGTDRVLAGAVTVDAQRTEPGEVEVFSDQRRVRLAPLGPPARTLARDVAARLASAGIDARVAASADGLLWEQFVGLEPLATACAVTQLSLGPLRAQPIALRFLRGLFDEVFDVANAVGAGLGPDVHARRWQAYLDGPATMRPSLAIDVAAGRTGELDWLTGAVVRLAEQARVRVPLHLDAFRMLRPDPGSSAVQGLHTERAAGLRPAA